MDPSHRASREYLSSIVVASVLAMVGAMVGNFTGYIFPALLFLMAIVICGLTWHRGPVLALATLSALIWNFLFIPPRFTLHIANPEDAFMFAIFFAVAISMGNLTSRLNQREKSLSIRQKETESLLAMVQIAALQTHLESGLQTAIQHIEDSLDTPVNLQVLDPYQHRIALTSKRFHLPTQPEQAADPPPSATWFPLKTRHGEFGAIGFIPTPDTEPLESNSTRLRETIALQLALIIEREHLLKTQREAAVVAESEKLHQILFDSVSHELKTPVAIIRAALDGLPPANPMCQEIHTACQRLQRILDDFLDVTRVESASLSVQPEWIDLIDVVEAAKERAITDPTPSQQIITHGLDLLPPVRVDGRLIARALGNLIQNALAYGPVNEPIEISAQYLNDHLEISVEDRGPGIPSEHLETVFNKFFRLPGAPAGGTGLGLAIARGLLKTHNGNVHLKPRDAGGTVAILSVPTELFQDHALNHAASPDHRG